MSNRFFRSKFLVLMTTFLFGSMLFFWANQAPAAAPAPAAEKNSGTTLEQGDSNSPNFVEQESEDEEDEAIIRNGKKFPWLLVGIGAVVVGVAIYFLVIKKPKYTMTVNFGTGTAGTPALTAKYKKGTVVSYNYTPQTGYGSLLVKLDGVAVAASGTVTMNTNHTLDVSANQQYTLTVNLGSGTTGEAATTTYNKDQVVNYSYAAQDGYSSLQVMLDNVVVSNSGTVTMNTNHTLDVSANQQYTLTVNLGSGTTGTPAATTTYNKDQVVNYSYTAQAGYSSLQVMLDNVVVSNSGTVTMNTNHTLDVTADQQYVLTVNLGTGTTGTPAATTTYNKDQVVNYSYTAQTGYTSLQVELDNIVVAASGTVTMNSNHTLSVSATNNNATFINGVLTVKGVRYDLVAIPAGTFQMGSTSPEANANEQPVHTVHISQGFWLGKTEVTQGLWKAVMGSNPSEFQSGDNYPVEKVSWEDCQAFITKLHQLLGGNYFRLPTEAEWEYACRAGTTGNYYGNLDDIAWYLNNSGGYFTHPVGQKQANSFGLYDMSGSVWEWCHDWFGVYLAGYQTDPAGPWSGSFRVNRGGSFGAEAKYERSAQRNMSGPGLRVRSIGFRLASGSAGD